MASSKHKSSKKPDSGVWFIRWQCKVLSQSFVILSLDPYKKQLTKETHFVSETGLAELNKQFLSELYGHWHLITESNRLGLIYSEAVIVAYRKDKSLKDLLVRAKIPSHI